MRSVWFLILFGSLITYHCFTGVSGESSQGQEETESKPSYSQCKPYVDAALKGESPQEDGGGATSAATAGGDGGAGGGGSKEDDDDDDDDNDSDSHSTEDGTPTQEEEEEEKEEGKGRNARAAPEQDSDGKDDSGEGENSRDSASSQDNDDDDSKEAGEPGIEEEEDDSKEANKKKAEDDDDDSGEAAKSSKEDNTEEDKSDSSPSATQEADDDDDDSKEAPGGAAVDDDGDDDDSKEKDKDGGDDDDDSKEQAQEAANASGSDDDSGEDSKEEAQSDGSHRDNVANETNQSDSDESQEEQAEAEEAKATAKTSAPTTSAVKDDDDDDSSEKSDKKDKDDDDDSKEDSTKEDDDSKEDSAEDGKNKSDEDDDDDDSEEDPGHVPRSREHLERILALDDSIPTKELSNLVDKATQTTLKELKSIYEQAIKPLETLYKYRDLSNRHFGDPEIFSKPMVVFMGPWSGGKSTIINWLLGIQDDEVALRTGADPSPAQFNIMTHGNEDEILDGTQLAADWTFSGLQKFGQAFLDRLRGRKLPNRLLEKVNLVEIPGILEVRKQVERSFPFNDACQWFIDRADILFLVYDPAKLDIGPETEAILDQLKGRENQVRIVLNKADTVKPDELLRLQATLIWNISPLMASAEPPILYVASLWGRPLNPDSPTSLLLAHENHFLQDIRDATEKRVETRIAAARRFAVRVRNHGKMCDCYLNTYNNHRSFFSNKKKISDDIIEHPQNYHIYEGLSTLTNISRYDLPDPDTYRDFFRLNPLWEFPTLASTCTYFRGCPINKLDIAIAYDLPELLGRYRRQRESIYSAQQQQQGQQAGGKAQGK